MCIRFALVLDLSNSPAICGVPPVPEVPKESPPGCVFDKAMTSVRVLAGRAGLATSIKVASPIFPTGTKSLTVSKGVFAKTCGLMTIVPSNPRTSVYPSAAAVLTKLVPMLPEAPGLLSTIICCPNLFPRCSAIKRPLVSVTPPGVNGTTKRIVLLGHAS